MMAITHEHHNWSDIPADILESILSRLSFFDTLGFGGVCSSWRFAVKTIRNPKTFPLLLFFTLPSTESSREEVIWKPDATKSDNDRIFSFKKRKRQPRQPTRNLDKFQARRSEALHPYQEKRIMINTTTTNNNDNNNVCFYSINDDMTYMPRNIQFHRTPDHRLIGTSPDGCLHLLDEYHSHYFLKLVPPIQPIQPIQLPGKVVLHDEKVIPNTSIYKSIWSVRNPSPNQDDLIVIMMYGSNYGRKLAFWRNDDNKLTRLQGEGYFDIAFCNNTHTLYALKIVDVFGFVYVERWDFSATGSCLPKKKSSIYVSCLRGCMSREDGYYHVTRLAVHSLTGEVLVLAYGGKHKDDLNKKWLIMKVDLLERRCIQVHSLNGDALLLSKTTSLFVSSIDVQCHGYRPNSIYFVNWWKGGDEIMKLSNYSMEDGQVRHIWDAGRSPAVGFYWIELSI